MAYTKKLVAFTDILGFKSKTNIKGDDEKNKVHSNLLELKKFSEKINNSNKGYSNSIKSFRFSDSCMFSAPEDKLTQLLQILHLMQLHFAANNFFIRGAVTYAEIYDENNFFYGKGMNQAYELESKKAIYPRIILDPQIFPSSRTPSKKTLSENLNDKISENTYISEDFDKIKYIDFFNKSNLDIENNPDLHQNHDQTLEKIKKHIDFNIQKNRCNPNILLKYLWLDVKYNAHISSTNTNFHHNCLFSDNLF